MNMFVLRWYESLHVIGATRFTHRYGNDEFYAAVEAAQNPMLLIFEATHIDTLRMQLSDTIRRSLVRHLYIARVNGKLSSESKALLLTEGFDQVADQMTSARLFQALIGSLQRRGIGPSEADLRFGRLRIDRRAHRVFASETELRVTKSQFEILCCLAAANGMPVSRAVLASYGMRGRHLASRTLDVHVCGLRRELRARQFEIVASRKNGYYLVRRDYAKAL